MLKISKKLRNAILKYHKIKNKLIKPYSYANRCGKDAIYITMFKCANTSIKKAIRSKFKYRLEIKNNELKKELREKFVFTFVRNPYSRILSYYIDKVLNKSGKNDYLPIELNFLTVTKIPFNFKDFVRIICLMDDEITDTHLKQMSYIIDKTTKKDVWVGKVENMKKDWNIVRKKIGLPKITIENKSNHSLFNEYFDKETADLIYMRYKNDFLRFGYKRDSWKKLS